jgi:hypothetical protein
MQLFKIVIVGLMVGGSALAGFATWRNVGAQTFEHPEGISLRQESVRTSRTGFFPYYARSRYHRGGGLSGGK